MMHLSFINRFDTLSWFIVLLSGIVISSSCTQKESKPLHAPPIESNISDSTLIQLLGNKADSFLNLGEFDSAMHYYRQAEKKISPNKSWEDYLIIRSNIAIVYEKQSANDSAYFILQSCLSLLQKQRATADTIAISIYESIGDYFLSQGNQDSMQFYRLKALAVTTQNFPADHFRFGDLYNYSGVYFATIGEMDSAIFYLTKALQIRENVYGKKHSNVSVIHRNLQFCYQQTGDIEKLIWHGKRALEIAESFQPQEPEALAFSLSDLGVGYGILGDLNQAEMLERKALAIYQKIFPLTHINICLSYSNLGAYISGRGDYHRAISFHQKAIRTFEQRADNQSHINYLAGTYNNLAYAYAQLGNHKLQLESAKQAAKIMEDFFGPNHPQTANIYHNLAIAYGDNEDYQTSLLYHTKVFNIRQALPATNLERVNTESYLGRTFLKLGKKKEAQNAYEQAHTALDILSDHKIDLFPSHLEMYSSIYSTYYVENGNLAQAIDSLQSLLLRVEHIRQSRSFSDSLEIRAEYYPGIIGIHRGIIRAHHASYLKNQNQKHLKEMVSTYQDLLAFLQEIYPSLQDEKSKLSWIKALRDSPELEEVLLAAYLLNQSNEMPQKTILNIMQQTKSVMLAAKYADMNARYDTNLPDSILQKEQELGAYVNYYQRLANSSNSSDTTFNRLKDKIFQYQSLRDSLLLQIKDRYPTYYKRKYEIPAVNIESIRKELLTEAGEQIIEYYWGNNYVFVFALNRDEIKFHKVDDVNELSKHILQFNEMLHTLPPAPNTYSSKVQFAQNAYYLYQHLLQPVVKSTDSSKLIIIPDGQLTQLPFEILMDTNISSDSSIRYKNMPYLINRSTIRYRYSSALHFEDFLQDTKNLRNFIGFAPAYEEATSAYSARKDGVTHISAMMKGELFTGSQALKTTFQDKIDKYKIFHFGGININHPTNPLASYLWFSAPSKAQPFKVKDELFVDSTKESERLYASDIYNLNLSLDLGVLAGCGTGSGQYEVGEGTLSIARALNYAGCRNVVMSLWPVVEGESSKLLNYYYAHLVEGISKDVALRKAKLQYLKDDNELPYYWASYVTLGDDKPVDITAFPPWYFYVILSGTILLILMFLTRFILRSRIKK